MFVPGVSLAGSIHPSVRGPNPHPFVCSSLLIMSIIHSGLNMGEISDKMEFKERKLWAGGSSD